MKYDFYIEPGQGIKIDEFVLRFCRLDKDRNRPGLKRGDIYALVPLTQSSVQDVGVGILNYFKVYENEETMLPDGKLKLSELVEPEQAYRGYINDPDRIELLEFTYGLHSIYWAPIPKPFVESRQTITDGQLLVGICRDKMETQHMFKLVFPNKVQRLHDGAWATIGTSGTYDFATMSLQEIADAVRGGSGRFNCYNFFIPKGLEKQGEAIDYNLDRIVQDGDFLAAKRVDTDGKIVKMKFSSPTLLQVTEDSGTWSALTNARRNNPRVRDIKESVYSITWSGKYEIVGVFE